MASPFGIIWSALIVLTLLFAAGCSDPSATGPNAGAGTTVADLPEVPAVNTADMQPAVRKQVEAAQARLLEAPADAAANGRYAMLLQAYDLNAAAAAAYARTGAVDSDNADWPYLQGIVLDELGRPEDARRAFERALALRPDDVRARVGLGAVLAATGRLDDSVAAYRLALAADPAQLDARFGLARQLLRQGEVDAAIEELTRLTGGAREYGPVHSALANAYRQQGDAAAAARHTELFKRHEDSKLPLIDARLLAVEALRVDAQPLLEKAAAAYGSGNFQGAVAAYRKALEVDPDNAGTHASLAGILADLGRIDEAESHFDRAVELDPTQTAPHKNIGTAYMKAGRMADAERAFSRALVLDETDAESWARYGYTRELQGDPADAGRAYGRALESDPNQPLANFLIGRQTANEEGCDVALPYYERSVAQTTDSSTPAYLLGLAQCYGRLGRYDEAFAALDRGKGLATRYRNTILLGQLETAQAQLSAQRAAAN